MGTYQSMSEIVAGFSKRFAENPFFVYLDEVAGV